MAGARRNTDPSICDSCRGIDFQSLWKRPHRRRSPSHEDQGGLQRSRICALCNILPPPSDQYASDDDLLLQSYLFPDHSEWSFPGASPAIQLCYYDQSEIYFHPSRLDHVFFEPYERSDKDSIFLRPRSLEAEPDYDTARAWLDNCQNCHGSKCNDSSPAQVDNLRLIDCDTARVVSAVTAVTPVRWIALSYVWGDKKQVAELRSATDTDPLAAFPSDGQGRYHSNKKARLPIPVG
jgi:hypothetical protein